jgi:hypothetical protein
MGRAQKTLERLLRGQSDANVDFADLTALLRALGFEERIRGSHHVFGRFLRQVGQCRSVCRHRRGGDAG